MMSGVEEAWSRIKLLSYKSNIIMRLVCQCFRLYVVDSVYNTLLSEMLTEFF